MAGFFRYAFLIVDAEAKSILIIEDEPDMAMGLKDALQFEGYRVVTESQGEDGIIASRRHRPHCIILDLMLPDLNGYKVCEEIRAFNPTVPIIMLTARSQEADKLRGFDSGADDYVTKPFSVAELLARISAVFRRVDAAASASDAQVLTLGDVKVDLRSQTATDGGRVQQLGFYEVEILRYLAEREGSPVSRDDILDRVWGIEASPTNRTVDNFIVKLRRKLEKNPNDPRHILTVYGQGYKLVT
ncbi:MAG: response regulator transcription factor [Deltaproteobacteria bacterium]|nr:response regulator transcription factor [Deltaproteobacteria bacterium]